MYNAVPREKSTTIRQRIHDVLERIERVCQRAGRNANTVELIAVTKTHSLDVVREAFDAGIRHFGENRVQELKLKSQAMPGVTNGGSVNWHMIGHIQRNKAKDVVKFADFVHALDTLNLAEELNRRSGIAGKVMPCLVQVNVSNEHSKFGLNPVDVPGFMDELTQYEHLNIQGFMTLASPAADPEMVRPQFALLRSIKENVQSSMQWSGKLETLSMGMSGDFEVAIEEGATHVRVGSALFGARG